MYFSFTFVFLSTFLEIFEKFLILYGFLERFRVVWSKNLFSYFKK